MAHSSAMKLTVNIDSEFFTHTKIDTPANAFTHRYFAINYVKSNQNQRTVGVQRLLSTQPDKQMHYCQFSSTQETAE